MVRNICRLDTVSIREICDFISKQMALHYNRVQRFYFLAGEKALFLCWISIRGACEDSYALLMVLGSPPKTEADCLCVLSFLTSSVSVHDSVHVHGPVCLFSRNNIPTSACFFWVPGPWTVFSYLYMAVNKPVELNIVVVFAEGVDQYFCDFEPSHVETELPTYQARTSQIFCPKFHWMETYSVELLYERLSTYRKSSSDPPEEMWR